MWVALVTHPLTYRVNTMTETTEVYVALPVTEVLNLVRSVTNTFHLNAQTHITHAAEKYCITEQEICDSLSKHHQLLLSRVRNTFKEKPAITKEYLTVETIAEGTVIPPHTLQPIVKAFFNFHGIPLICDTYKNALLPKNNLALFKLYLWNNFPMIAVEIVTGSTHKYFPVQPTLPITPKDNQYLSLDDIYHICNVNKFIEDNSLSSEWLVKLYGTYVYFNGQSVNLKTTSDRVLDTTLSLAILEKFPILKLKLKTFWEEFNKTLLDKDREEEKQKLKLAIEIAAKHLDDLNRKYLEL